MDTEGLSTICAGLGSIEEDEEGNRIGYVPEEYCLDNLKDLLRFLRRDDPFTRDVFKQVCKWNIVAKDLIPIVEHCQDDLNLVLNAVKVLVFLTLPLEASSKDMNEQLEYLWDIKSAITSSDVIAVIVTSLEKPLEKLEFNTFTEEDWKLIQLVFTLLRNILAVQDISVQQKAVGSANQLLSLRDNFLERLFQENVMDLIIIVIQHVGGACLYLRHDNLLFLEIFDYIFMGQDPKLIAEAHTEDSKVEGDAKTCLESLKSIMQEESEKRKLTRIHAGRHSQFSGTFTRVTMDGSKTMCMGVPSSLSCDKLLKLEKVHRGRSKSVVKDYAQLPTTKRSILERLHDFLNQFLTGGYNVLMQSIAEDIEKEHHAIQNNDVLMFFQLAQFVMSFQYHKSLMAKLNTDIKSESSVSDNDGTTWFKGDICGPIAATMNESMFGLVIEKWHFAFDGLKETKNNAFLSVAGSLMKIMIRLLDLVLKLMPENSKEPQTARIILYKLFYDQTDQGLTQFLLNMLRSFDPHKQPKSDLADLVEIIHVVIRLMEKLQAHGTLRVSRKARRTRRKKTDDIKNTANEAGGNDIPIQNEIQSSDSIDPPNLDNNEDCSRPIGCDGNEENVNVPTQVVGIEPAAVEKQKSDGRVPQGSLGEPNQIDDNFITGVDDNDSSADDQLPETDEVDFKLTTLLSYLASSSIISNLCWLLKFYKSNSTSTNHYILCLLRRICDDLDLAPMLYQLSCLVMFYDILNEQKACAHKEYENVVHFLTSHVRRMLRKMKSQPLLFVDVLFWKTRKDCHYINVESIQHEIGGMRKEVRKWGNVGETGLPQNKERTRKSVADALGDDEYDVIISNEPLLEKDGELDEAAGDEILPTAGSMQHNIYREEDLVKGGFKGVMKRKRRLVLNDKLEERVRDLYEKLKDNPNCNQLIAEALDPDGNISPAQVSWQCKKLGLQLPSKKSTNQAHFSNSSDQYKEGTAEIGSSLPDSNDPDGPLLRRPLHTRKRVRALDENQELKIRSLFEQFKDHKRCSHMIAKELDPDGAVTAAQVSRKLKKLGLQTPRMRTESNRHMIDDVDDYTDGEEDSGNVTLSSLRKRNKNKDDASFSGKELANPDNVESSGHTSDNEMLSSVLNKFPRGHSKEEKLAGTSTKQAVAGQDLQNQIAQGLGARDGSGQAGATEINIDAPATHSPSSSSKHEAVGTSNWGESGLLQRRKYGDLADSGNDYGSPPEKDAGDIQNRNKYSDLEDSGDEQTLAASASASAKRRKLRVVLDFDDDE